MAREIAAVNKMSETEAVRVVEINLNKGPQARARSSKKTILRTKPHKAKKANIRSKTRPSRRVFSLEPFSRLLRLCLVFAAGVSFLLM